MKKKLDPQEKARRQAWRDQRYEEHIRSEQEKAKAATQEPVVARPARSGKSVLTVGALAASVLAGAGVELPRL